MGKANSTTIVAATPYRVTYENFVGTGELGNLDERAQKEYISLLCKLGYTNLKMLGFALKDTKGIQTRSLLHRLGMLSRFETGIPDIQSDGRAKIAVKAFEDEILGSFQEKIKISLKKCLKIANEETRELEEVVRTEILSQKQKKEEEVKVGKAKAKKYLSIQDVIGKPSEEMGMEDVRKAVLGCPIEPRHTWAEVLDDPEYLCALRLYFSHVTNVDICKYLFRDGVDNSTLGDKFIKLGVKQNTIVRRTLYGLETAAFVDWAGGDVEAYLKKENEKVGEINKCMERALAKKTKRQLQDNQANTPEVVEAPEVVETPAMTEAAETVEAPEVVEPVEEPTTHHIELSISGSSAPQLLRMLADIVEEFSEDSRGELTVDYIGI